MSSAACMSGSGGILWPELSVRCTVLRSLSRMGKLRPGYVFLGSQTWLDHPAIDLMWWTPKDTLTELKNEDKHQYAARILAGSRPAFDKRIMSRYWIECFGNKYATMQM
jgi:hypothetical protein